MCIYMYICLYSSSKKTKHTTKNLAPEFPLPCTNINTPPAPFDSSRQLSASSGTTSLTT